MKARRLSLIGSGLLLAVSLAAVFGLQRARLQAQADLQLAQQREAAVRAASKLATQRLRSAREGLLARQRSGAEMSQRATGAEKTGKPMDWSAYLTTHPELQRAFETAFVGLQAQKYGPLFRRLGLTSDQIDRIDRLMAKDIENTVDLVSAARARNLPFTDPTIVQLKQAQAADLASQEQAIIGADNLGELQKYTAEMYVRGDIGVATSTAVASEAGMSADLEEQATQLVVHTSSSFQKNPTQPIDPASVDWSVLTTQGQSFLTPVQLAAIQSVAAQEKFLALKAEYFQKQAAATK